MESLLWILSFYQNGHGISSTRKNCSFYYFFPFPHYSRKLIQRTVNQPTIPKSQTSWAQLHESLLTIPLYPGSFEIKEQKRTHLTVKRNKTHVAKIKILRQNCSKSKTYANSGKISIHNNNKKK